MDCALSNNVKYRHTHTIEALMHFAGPTDKSASFYCDNAPELAAAARACKWRFATATTGQPHTNGVAGGSVRAVGEGGGCGIAQSGYNPKRWPDAGAHACFSKHIAMGDVDSSYNR